MKVNDIQFVKYFLTQESDAPDDVIQDVLSKSVDILPKGTPDTISLKGDTIVYQNPSSVTMFLFNILHFSLASKIENHIQRDKLGLGIAMISNFYTLI